MQDPLKQGLKRVPGVMIGLRHCIRMQDPLKQGLKPTQRLRRREKGRIIRMQDPLKQGLKPCFGSIPSTAQRYSNARSTKTRIETISAGSYFFETRTIRMQDPLKQGLKRPASFIARSLTKIRMQDPLKQGLKPETHTATAGNYR